MRLFYCGRTEHCIKKLYSNARYKNPHYFQRHSEEIEYQNCEQLRVNLL